MNWIFWKLFVFSRNMSEKKKKKKKKGLKSNSIKHKTERTMNVIL